MTIVISYFMFNEFISNKILWVVVIAWFTAQVLKVCTHAYVYKTFDLKRLVGDGGMPSCHSAVVSSMTLYVGLVYGFNTPVFAISAIFAFIVMHDASGVRLETGKQAKVIKSISEILEDLTNTVIDDEKLKEFVGHTHLQVFMGALLGFVVAIICFNIFG